MQLHDAQIRQHADSRHLCRLKVVNRHNGRRQDGGRRDSKILRAQVHKKQDVAH